MSIDTTLIKKLREKTGAGMADCKRAISESNSDIEQAVSWLRKRGLALANKKADRDTEEGVIAINIQDNSGSIIELNSETDFVGKNQHFLSLADKIAQSVHNNQSNSPQELLKSGVYKNIPVSALITDAISMIGENIRLKRFNKISVNKGRLIKYLHNQLSENTGSIGVIVSLEGDINKEVEEFGKQIAMHIAALKPISLSIDDINQDVIKKEREIFREQILRDGTNKPKEMIEKIIEGKVKKFLGDVVLLEQMFVLDGKTKVKTAIEKCRSQTKCDFTITGYLRYEV